MKPGLVEHIRCPRCYGSVALETESEREGTIYGGALDCLSCGAGYRIEQGVALLAAIDRTWRPMIGEVLSRAEITERVVEDGGFEKDREEAADEYHEAASGVMTELFNDAFDGVETGPGTRVLDLGAGIGQTASAIADLGADVVAADVEFSHLLYMNFWPQDIVYTEGFPLPVRNPTIYEAYFSRVVSDIHRIPFADATFDVTFCRSTMHHLDDVAGGIREMARVTRPGGRILLISEPVRSFLDQEAEYLKGIFDYEEGLNENTGPITTYTLPLRKYCDDIEVRYFSPVCLQRTRRLMDALRFDPAKHFFDGEVVGFRRSFKLLLSGASLNVRGRRNRRTPSRPKKLAERSIIADPYDLIVCDKEKENRLRAVYRSCLKPTSLPTAIDPAEAERGVLSKGWREPEHRSGVAYRYTHKVARCYLRDDRAKESVTIRMLGFPEQAGAPEGTISVNGVEACRFTLTSWDSNVSFYKPPSAERILELEIRNDRTYIPDEVLGNGDRRELGVGIVRIWQE